MQLQNEVSNSVGCSSVSWGMESQRLLCLCWHHSSSHSLTQYSVSCCVFLGMQTLLCPLSPAAKGLLLLVVAGVCLISGHGGSYLLMTRPGSGSKKMQSILNWWSASSLLSLHHSSTESLKGQGDPWFFSSVVILRCFHDFFYGGVVIVK